MAERQIARSGQNTLGRFTARRVTIRTYERDATADEYSDHPRQPTANSPYTDVPAFVSANRAPQLEGDGGGQEVIESIEVRIPADAGPVADDVLAAPDADGLYPSEIEFSDGSVWRVLRIIDDKAGYIRLTAE